MQDPDLGDGLVIRIKGSEYFVFDSGEEIICAVRGRFRIGREEGEVLPVVGDEVEYRAAGAHDSRGPRGLITAVRPRSSVFVRAGAGGRGSRILGANLDMVFLVHAVREPDLNRRLVDRMLVSAEAGGIEPVLCINKVDLERPGDRLGDTASLYGGIGYEVVECSAMEGRGIGRLAGMMSGRLTMMAGPSGAGKTSILSAIEPGLEERTGEVSARTGKGKHTTTHFELHRLSSGGWLADTPGIREFGVQGIEPRELGACFREFRPVLGRCRFNTCTHSHEPGCAVKEAVEEGKIDGGRYESYLRMLDEHKKKERPF